MVVSLLAGSFGNINTQTRDGRTPLHLNALTGQNALVLGLVDHCASVDARDARGESPLVEAS
ncbi:conserved unknown protein [Ectocarpus siliculosus]|uniref:Uncharacterized protein n=1 Tax=Ectocarpus siliculosus TaxID=2880 RepID=D7G8R6_ECTSI|nr:conserved unknown protein [Ectocarpus siliculosus]|eukprot:CBJ28090.1 conserved unknown protein [Ectocarpus siliculosus]